MKPAQWKLSTETLLNLLQTAAILTGMFFGLRELGELRKSRELESTLKLVDIAQNEVTWTAFSRLVSLPANLPEDRLNQELGEQADKVWTLAGNFDALGILVHRGEVSLDLVDEFLGGDIVLSWQKLRPSIARLRERTGNPQGFEWFQWLAERLQEHRAKPGTAPAYVKYRNWEP